MKLPSRTALAALAALSLNIAPAFANELTRAEVRRVDVEGGKVLLRHEHIVNLDMPPMSMVFDVADRTQLANLKAGDKVTFAVKQHEGRLVVTHIEPVATP